MAKKGFWQGLKDFFKDDEPHLITDEEWETMQAEGEETPQDEDGWRCPECRHKNGEDAPFCSRCGFHPGSFEGLLAQMTDAQLRLVLEGSVRYDAAQRAEVRAEQERRAAAAADPARLAALTAQQATMEDTVLQSIAVGQDPVAAFAARQLLAERDVAVQPAVKGWQCGRCGAENAAEAYFCTGCGEYRY